MIRQGRLFDPPQYCLQCTQCGARGPILNVNEEIEDDTIKAMMKQRFSERKQCDEGLFDNE